jgi:hypothetical protein
MKRTLRIGRDTSITDKCMENFDVPGEDSSLGKSPNVEVFLVIFR